jgi:hypothetical protein
MEPRANVFIAALWMVAITLALFFVPLVNGLIGGVVGGYKAGTPKRGVIAAIIPAAVVGVALWLLLTAFALPVLGLVAGAALGMVILLADVGLLIGALIGGAYAARERDRRLPAYR